jgi:hypothetical protein
VDKISSLFLLGSQRSVHSSQLLAGKPSNMALGEIFMGQSYRELIAWQIAMSFVMDIYKTTRSYPRDEAFGLASLTRRAAVAIPTNIAEGQARHSANDFFYFSGQGERRAG